MVTLASIGIVVKNGSTYGDHFLYKCALISIVKVKVKPSRYTPWRRLGERSYSSYSFTTSALDGGETVPDLRLITGLLFNPQVIYMNVE
jgi:hypothetical protein